MLKQLADRPRYYRLAEAARELYPVPVCPATPFRHITKGKRLSDSTILRLKATLTPGGWVVTREDVQEFFAAITADRLGKSAPATSSGRKAAERAERELDRAGI